MKWTEGDGQVWRLYDAGVLIGFVVKEDDVTYNAVWKNGGRSHIEPMTTLKGAMIRVADEVLAGERDDEPRRKDGPHPHREGFGCDVDTGACRSDLRLDRRAEN